MERFFVVTSTLAIVSVVACRPGVPTPPSGPDTTVTAPPVAPTVDEAGKRYRGECTDTPDPPRPGQPPTGRLTFSLVSEEATSGAVVWSRPLGEIWGAYSAADCAPLGYSVDHVSFATLAGARALLAHSPGGTWHIVEPSTGATIVDRLWAAPLPKHEGPLVVLGRERIAINAVPGRADRIRLRNDGHAVAVEDSYRRIDFEVPGGDGARRVATEPATPGGLRIFARGETLELFVSADTARAIQGNRHVSAVFLVYELDERGRPTRPTRATVELPE